jgi:NAD(P)-dependent dehydrogenase (short-subunit alcohol dehydrogenase family)
MTNVYQDRRNNGALDGQCAWVLGASGAIGSAVAELLARQGVTVWLSGRDKFKLDALQDRIAQAGGQARVRVLDATIADEVTHAAREIVRQSGKINILINSTATSTFGEFLDLTDADWERTFQNKLMVYVRSMRAVLPTMIKAGGGVIINISGKAGKLPSPAHLPGGSMNAAVNLLTKGISDRYKDQGIRANTIAPGPIASERFDALAEKLVSSPSANPLFMSTKGTPEDVAQAVLWLVGPHARHLNGIVLPLDGGATPTV